VYQPLVCKTPQDDTLLQPKTQETERYKNKQNINF